ncbi:helix-turn-helix transcriptional regulator [Priestia flexa]|uniref:helix-turn-helix transcriptional regulator n=1 Tax=Priestia flexa TaxID=86664 RepID=UPI001F4C819C|nr:helix-turn-helix domain-containing protein [Priestia flexa]
MNIGVVAMPKKSQGELDSKLKVRFAQLKISQIEVAEIMGESKQTISGWSTGRIEPTLKKAFRLAKVLDCKVDDLWDYTEDDE